MKKFVFAALAIAAPAGVFFWQFRVSEGRFLQEYNEKVEQLREDGLIVTSSELKATLPSKDDNALVPLLTAGRSFDWLSISKLNFSITGKYLAATEPLEKALMEAAMRDVLVLPYEESLQAQEVSRHIGQVLQVGAERSLAHAANGDSKSAVETLRATGHVRDLLAQTTHPRLAFEAFMVSDKIRLASLSLGARFGNKVVDQVKPLAKGVRIDSESSSRAYAAYQIAALEALVAKGAAGDPRYKTLIDRGVELDMKIAIMDTATFYRDNAASRSANEVALRLTDTSKLFQVRGLTAPIMDNLSFTGLTYTHFDLPPDLLEWFWISCRKRGNPVGKTTKGYRNEPIRYLDLKGGDFMILAVGRNGVDERGLGDDRWIKYSGGKVTFKN